MHGLSTVSLRYGNVYGPRQDPLGEAGVVAIFCGLLLEGGQPTVFGDGLQTRDYVYVGDVVGANLAAAAANATGSINIGTGVESTVLDIVATLAEHSANGVRAPAGPGPAGRGAPHRAGRQPRARRSWSGPPRCPLATGLEPHARLPALGRYSTSGRCSSSVAEP